MGWNSTFLTWKKTGGFQSQHSALLQQVASRSEPLFQKGTQVQLRNSKFCISGTRDHASDTRMFSTSQQLTQIRNQNGW